MATQRFMQPRHVILAQPGLLLVRCTDAAGVLSFQNRLHKTIIPYFGRQAIARILGNSKRGRE